MSEDADIVDLAQYYEAQLRRARLDAQQARAEAERMAKRVQQLHSALTGLLDEFARPGEPTVDWTALVLDTQTRVLVEPRNE